MTERTAASLKSELGRQPPTHPKAFIDLIDSVRFGGDVSDAEYAYLNGVTSAIQTQLDNKQALDASLTAYAAVTTAADKMVYYTGADVPVAIDLTTAGRALLDDANAGAQLATLGVTAAGIALIDDATAAAQLVTLGVNATAAELNNAADLSARVVELTASGAVGAGVQVLELNHATVVIAATMNVAQHLSSYFIVKDTSATGTEAHTLTLTNGTFNGTNAIATLNARDEFLCVYFDSAGRGSIIENVGSVALSS